MTKDEVFIKLKTVLIETFELNDDAVKPEALLFEDLGLDSIDAVDMIVKMKSYVKGNVGPEDFKKAKTVQDIVDVLHALMQ
ncbi:MAG: phosphopantetheine-binding protein [Spirochaetaceae bacterium]|jgi:acyl carrier protein|nr:phosphopantetheine-binding protein [Spirochaetaceae bacterium]